LKNRDHKRDYFETDHLKADLKGHSIRAGGLVLFSRGTSLVIQLVSTVVLARLLTPEDHGVVAMVLSVTGFFMVLRDMGLTDATIQQAKVTHEQISTLFWINAAFGLLLAFIVASLAPVIAWFFQEPALKAITIVYAISFIMSGLYTQHMALLRRGMYFRQLTLVEIFSSVFSVFVAIIMAVRGFGYWALVARPIVLAVSMAILVWYFCRWRPGKPSRRSGVGSMLRFGANTLGYFVINYFAKSFDKILIGWRFGAVSLGFYHKASTLSSLPAGQMTIPLQSVAVTTLSKLKTEPAKYHKYFLNAIGTLSLIGMPVCGFLAADSKDIVYFLLGSQWDAAAPLVTVLSIAALLQLVGSTNGWLHVSLGHADRWFRWGIIGSSVTVISFIAGLPFGAMGVAVSYATVSFILTGPSLVYAGKPIGLTLMPMLDAVWRYFVASVLAGILTKYLFAYFLDFEWILVRLFVFGVLYSIFYLLFVIILHGSVAPIKQFLNHLRVLIPDRFAKKSLSAAPADPS